MEIVTVKLVAEFTFVFRPSFSIQTDGHSYQATSHKYGVNHLATSWTQLLEQMIDFSDPIEMQWLLHRGIGF